MPVERRSRRLAARAARSAAPYERKPRAAGDGRDDDESSEAASSSHVSAHLQPSDRSQRRGFFGTIASYATRVAGWISPSKEKSSPEDETRAARSDDAQRSPPQTSASAAESGEESSQQPSTASSSRIKAKKGARAKNARSPEERSTSSVVDGSGEGSPDVLPPPSPEPAALRRLRDTPARAKARASRSRKSKSRSSKSSKRSSDADESVVTDETGASSQRPSVSLRQTHADAAHDRPATENTAAGAGTEANDSDSHDAVRKGSPDQTQRSEEGDHFSTKKMAEQKDEPIVLAAEESSSRQDAAIEPAAGVGFAEERAESSPQQRNAVHDEESAAQQAATVVSRREHELHATSTDKDNGGEEDVVHVISDDSDSSDGDVLMDERAADAPAAQAPREVSHREAESAIDVDTDESNRGESNRKTQGEEEALAASLYPDVRMWDDDMVAAKVDTSVPFPKALVHRNEPARNDAGTAASKQAESSGNGRDVPGYLNLNRGIRSKEQAFARASGWMSARPVDPSHGSGVLPGPQRGAHNELPRASPREEADAHMRQSSRNGTAHVGAEPHDGRMRIEDLLGSPPPVPGTKRKRSSDPSTEHAAPRAHTSDVTLGSDSYTVIDPLSRVAKRQAVASRSFVGGATDYSVRASTVATPAPSETAKHILATIARISDVSSISPESHSSSFLGSNSGIPVLAMSSRNASRVGLASSSLSHSSSRSGVEGPVSHWFGASGTKLTGPSPLRRRALLSSRMRTLSAEPLSRTLRATPPAPRPPMSSGSARGESQWYRRPLSAADITPKPASKPTAKEGKPSPNKVPANNSSLEKSTEGANALPPSDTSQGAGFSFGASLGGSALSSKQPTDTVSAGGAINALPVLVKDKATSQGIQQGNASASFASFPKADVSGLGKAHAGTGESLLLGSSPKVLSFGARVATGDDRDETGTSAARAASPERKESSPLDAENTKVAQNDKGSGKPAATGFTFVAGKKTDLDDAVSSGGTFQIVPVEPPKAVTLKEAHGVKPFTFTQSASDSNEADKAGKAGASAGTSNQDKEKLAPGAGVSFAGSTTSPVSGTLQGTAPAFSFGTAHTDNDGKESEPSSRKKRNRNADDDDDEPKRSFAFGGQSSAAPKAKPAEGDDHTDMSSSPAGAGSSDKDKKNDDEPRRQPVPAFSFGGAPAVSTQPSMTTTEAANAGTMASSSAPAFTFGATPVAEKRTSADGSAPGFSFGAKAPSATPASDGSTAASAPAFSFGAASTPATDEKALASAPAVTSEGQGQSGATQTSNSMNAASSTPSFAFGASGAGSSAASSAPSFAFGASASGDSGASSAPSFAFGASASGDSSASSAPSVAFGASGSGDNAASSAPSFAFGASGAGSSAASSAPSFAFGASASGDSSASSAPSFAFGASGAGSSAASSAPSFAFGASGAGSSAASSAPSFAFGASASGDSGASSAPSFAFGASGAGSSAASSAPSFAFGASASGDSSASSAPSFAFGASGAGSSAASSAPSFAFGASASGDNAASSAPSFAFGASAASSSSTGTPSLAFGASSASGGGQSGSSGAAGTAAFQFNAPGSTNNASSGSGFAFAAPGAKAGAGSANDPTTTGFGMPSSGFVFGGNAAAGSGSGNAPPATSSFVFGAPGTQPSQANAQAGGAQPSNGSNFVFSAPGASTANTGSFGGTTSAFGAPAAGHSTPSSSGFGFGGPTGGAGAQFGGSTAFGAPAQPSAPGGGGFAFGAPSPSAPPPFGGTQAGAAPLAGQQQFGAPAQAGGFGNVQPAGAMGGVGGGGAFAIGSSSHGGKARRVRRPPRRNG